MVKKKIKVLLVGNPNVGKSALFNSMTGKYVAVSNYPGTTVEVTEGIIRKEGVELKIIDTPGMYSLLPISEEERVARDFIFYQNADIIVNVVDAKNLERMLPLTFQLIETKIPLILVVNMMDEAERSNISIDIEGLSEELGIPVVPAVSIKKKGVKAVFHHILNYDKDYKPKIVKYDDDIENAITSVENLLKSDYPVSKRTIALMLLQQDWGTIEKIVPIEGKDVIEKIDELRRTLGLQLKIPVDYALAVKRQLKASSLVQKISTRKDKKGKHPFVSFLSTITMSHIWGYPILFLVLYLGLYKFVGTFGAGFLVDLIQSEVFDKFLLPGPVNFIEKHIPYDIVKELLIRDYGILTLGIKYAIAIILPIVTTFFLFFSILEDSGYLPRLAMLLDRFFKKIGLTGRAVIPLVLGFGCDTMATMVTRTLSSKKERIITTILLSLAVPCSAQLGVMLAVLSHSSALLAVWVCILFFIFLLVGYLSNKVIKGEKTLFFVEIPPIRMPKLSNILVKTYTRLVWYFKEVIPLFIYASILIWIGRITMLFNLVIDMIAFFIRFIGLPKEAAVIFLFGFFRRDYGAAGLYDMHKNGVFNNNELLIMAVMLTLFLPCIAQFIMTIKERGLKTGIYIAIFVLFFSITVGYLLHLILTIGGIKL